MKKLLSLLTLSLVIGLGVANAQNQRIVVLECFTSATCGPCAQYNPQLDNIVNENSEKLIAIKYHVNWPSAGDPMNLHNPSEVSSRVSYYSVTGVPTSVADGNAWFGNSGSVSQSLVNQWAAVESPLEMRMTHYLNDTQDTITVVVMGRATSAIESNNLKLHISVIEKTMEYATAPGTNGERIFHNVMKKMLPGSSGTNIPSLQAGDYFAYTYSWALANVMNVSELTAVAWLQDHSTKTVYQGCKSSEDFQPYYAKQAQITGIDHTKKNICSGSAEPVVFVDNLGSETINSLTFNIKVNGEDVKQVTWNGNIPFTKEAKISLGEINFDVAEENEMLIEIAQINGAPDDYSPSIYSYTFEEAKLIVNKAFKLKLRTDDEPQLITWEVVNMNTGEVVVSGGPYDTPFETYNINFELENAGCYMFTIYDAGGNGLYDGSGIYNLKAGSTNIASGSKFTDQESNEFSFTKDDDIEEYSVNTANIYPNPSNGIVTVDTESSCAIAVYNTVGQMVLSQDINGKTMLDLSNLDKGTYLFVITSKNGEKNSQVIVLQ